MDDKTDSEKLLKPADLLCESEEKYRDLYLNAPFSYQSLNEEGCLIDVNPMWLNTLGYDKDEVIGKWFGNFLAPDFVDHFKNNFPAFKQQGYIHDVQFKMKCKDGRIIYVSFEGRIGYHPDGSFKHTYCVFQDITERKQTEEALQKNKERWESLFHNSPNAIAVYQAVDNGNDFMFTDFNLTAQKTDNIKYDDVVGRHISELFPSVEELGFLKIFRKVWRTGKTEHMNITNYKDDRIEGWRENIIYRLNTGEVVAIYNDISARMKAEIALRESEEKFRSIFENHSAIKLLIDPENGNIVDANEAAAEFYGWSRYQLKQIKIQQINTLPQDQVFDKMQQIRLQKQSHFEFRHRLKNGSVRDVEVFSSSIVIGGKVYLHSIIHDITERKHAENALRESEFFFRESQHAAFIGSYKYNIVNGFWGSSEVLDLIFGINKEYVRDVQGWEDLMHPDDREMMNLYLKEEVLGNRKPFNKEYRIVRKSDGKTRWVNGLGQLNFDAGGNILSLIGTIQDITDRKRAEKDLRESNELNTSLLHTIPFGIGIVDEHGNILFQSEELEKQFGRVALGKKCWSLYRDDKTQCFDCPLLSGIHIGKTEIYESHGVMGGRSFQINHTGMLFQGRKAMLEIFQDITERKLVEKELVKAKEKAEESDKLKTAFLHNISHEIRTPMNAIMGFSEFLGNPRTLPEKRAHFTDTIIQSSKQLLSIITDIINIATIEADQEQIYDMEFRLNPILKLLYAQFIGRAQKQGISLRFENSLQDNEDKVISDETKLSSILANLVGNALKFTSKGHVIFGYHVKGAYLEFYIEDTGIGISSAMHNEIFKRFRQVEIAASRQFGGSGLGLSISKAYVELLGGKIWVTSELGKGSVFYFTIPYKKINPDGLPDRPSEELKIELPKFKTLLIAEDEDSNFMLLEELLSDAEINIIRALNGAEAVELCKSNPHIDIVLMDIKMPVMDGLEATRQIKVINPGLPIIAQTAYSLQEEKEMALTVGCSAFLSKPIKGNELLKTLNQMLVSVQK